MLLTNSLLHKFSLPCATAPTMLNASVSPPSRVADHSEVYGLLLALLAIGVALGICFFLISRSKRRDRRYKRRSPTAVPVYVPSARAHYEEEEPTLVHDTLALHELFAPDSEEDRHSSPLSLPPSGVESAVESFRGEGGHFGGGGAEASWEPSASETSITSDESGCASD